MSLFNIFTNRAQTSGASKAFANAGCKCVQQELNLSELNWMDTSAYVRSKEMLKRSSSIAIRTRLAFNKQRDLFEGV
ncbi:MAG: hypothetical protein P8L86_02490 [Gammaproteobacteria bacterium]|nr:hypothetical protein [Gammaproteobacteria bacterium]